MKFRIRAAVFNSVCGVVAALLLTVPRSLYADEEQAVARIRAWNATIGLDPESKTVVRVSLSKRRIRDADLRQLGPLTTLRMLDISHTDISDEGLQHLVKLKSLVALDLSADRVTGEGLQHLKNLPALRILGLGGLQTTDATVRHLAELPNLSRLDLSRSRVTDDGLRYVNSWTCWAPASPTPV